MPLANWRNRRWLCGAIVTLLVFGGADVGARPPGRSAVREDAFREVANDRPHQRSNSPVRLLPYLDPLEDFDEPTPHADHRQNAPLAFQSLAPQREEVSTPLAQGDLIGAELLLNEAILAYQESRYREAWEILQQLDRANPVVAHYRGLTLRELGQDEQADAELSYAQQHLPAVRETWHGAMSTLPQVDPSELGDERAARPWNLSLLIGTEYDSNVRLAPEFNGLGSGFRRSDARAVVGLFGDYQLARGDDWNVGANGSLYQTAQFSLDEFNVSNFTGGLYANKGLGECWLVGTNYQFQNTLLDGDQFATNHRLVLNATYLEGWGHTTGYYEYDNLDIKAPALIPAQIRSGDTNAVGFTQAVYLEEGAGRLYLGYRYARTEADGADFDFHSNMFTARYETPLEKLGVSWLCDVVWDVEYRYFVEDYANPNSLDFSGRARDDRRSEFRTGAQKFFTKQLSLRTDYTFVDNSSNTSNLFGVHFYEYDRHIFSTQLIYDF